MNNIYDDLFKMWNDKRPRTKHRELNFAYFLENFEKLLECFKYENTPEGIDTYFLERYLLINGSAGATKSKKYPDKYVCFEGGYCGDLNEYGIGSSYVGASIGESYEFVIGEGGIVGQNNNIRTGRINLLERYSGLLADIEESIEVAIINSRILPVLEAHSDKDIKQIESLINQIRRGELKAITSNDTSIFEEKEAFKVHDITDPNCIQKLQYYSRFYEDTLKRFWIESGIEITNKDKAAQVTSDELQSFKEYSRITIEDMLKCREKMCDDFNKLYGTNWSVSLNHNFDNKVTEEDQGEEKLPEEVEKEGEEDGTRNSELD